MSRNFAYKKTSGGIKEFVHKKNGLTVLLQKNTDMPIVGIMVTYMVGSRNEGVGYTGSTHLLEHLMFKGSKNYNKAKGNSYDKVLDSLGGVINATTWMDRTNYFAILPKQHLKKGLELEADRMRNAIFSEQDRVDEMPAVRSEFEIGENDPIEVLDKQIWATAFQAHPYHHSTIGWKDDIENVSIERLREFYDTFYYPNNATVSVVGDFKEDDALKLVEKSFGKIERSKHKIPTMYTMEPVQQGKRHVEVERAGNTNIFGIAHKSVEATHKDTHALHVLTSILGVGRQSRLHKELVEKSLATEVRVYNFAFHDPTLLQVYARLNEGVSLQVVEDKVLEVYEKLKSTGVLESELNIAKANVKSGYFRSRDGVYKTISSINEAIATGDWTFYTKYKSKIDKVTKDDVKKVAIKYLIKSAETTGYFKGV